MVLSAVVPSRGERRALEALIASRCEAVVLLSAGEARFTDFGARLPVVEIGRPPNETVFDAVHTADDEGARLAVDHLVSLGHRDIVHVDGGPTPGGPRIDRPGALTDAVPHLVGMRRELRHRHHGIHAVDQGERLGTRTSIGDMYACAYVRMS